MTDQAPSSQATLDLYLTGHQVCSYQAERQTRSLFVDPLAPINGSHYQWLLENGFRRSGRFIYRPACPHCRSCVPVRIPLADFVPDRSQRRNQRLNAGLAIHVRPAGFDPEHYALYQTYLRARHPDGAMAEGTEDNYRRFLLEPWGGETLFIEWRQGDRLVAVAVTDVLPTALSAVYTFFDPADADLAPGTHAVLGQVAEGQRRGLEHLYLGYWIDDCRKMRYKERFRPLEAWNGRQWRRYQRGEPVGHGPVGKRSA